MPLLCAVFYNVPSGSFLLPSACFYAPKAGCRQDTELVAFRGKVFQSELDTKKYIQPQH